MNWHPSLISALRRAAAAGDQICGAAADALESLNPPKPPGDMVPRAALLQAVDAIREWHNMGVPEKQRSKLWDLYWRNAPEMKPIREALVDARWICSCGTRNDPGNANCIGCGAGSAE
jgi:hypothetical protein